MDFWLSIWIVLLTVGQILGRDHSTAEAFVLKMEEGR
jgi:hypothetical protein